MDIIRKIAFILLVIGGLNWGLVGLFGSAGDLVSYLPYALATTVYVLVGVSTLVVLFGTKMSNDSSEEIVQESATEEPISQPQDPMQNSQM